METLNPKISAIRNADDLPLVLKVPEVAKILGIGRNTAYNLVRSGAIKSIHVGRQIRVSRSALLEFLG